MNTPSFIEDHIAQLPALKLLMNIMMRFMIQHGNLNFYQV